tara:strand:+ start:135 stop:497 length:363 start_codon:yes stop_codon:yes gene_type:complete
MPMTQRSWLLALLSALTPPAALAVDLHKVATVEDQHQRPFWHLGEGFEGSSSDWTEYVVWLVGVIGVLYYMWNPNMRRNMHADDDDMQERTAYGYVRHHVEAEDEAEGEAEGEVGADKTE